MSDTTTADQVTETSVIDAPNESGDTSSSVIGDAIARLQNNQSRVYTTVQGDDFATKLKVMQAVTTAVSLTENMSKEGVHIDLENIVIQPVELTDTKTGEVTTQPRVILLDEDGTAYYGISPVLLKAVETFTGVLGAPSTWPESVGVKITKDKSNNGYFFFNMVLDPKSKAATSRKGAAA